MSAVIALRNRARDVVAWAVIDHDDLARVSTRPWCLGGARNAYARCNIDGRTTYMHRWLLGVVDDGLEVDHINGNKLDNRRANLRTIPHAAQPQNQAQRGRTAGRSPHRGVHWDRRTETWMARVVINKKVHHLGHFADEQEAAKVAAAFRRDHMPYSAEALEAQRAA